MVPTRYSAYEKKQVQHLLLLAANAYLIVEIALEAITIIVKLAAQKLIHPAPRPRRFDTHAGRTGDPYQSWGQEWWTGRSTGWRRHLYWSFWPRHCVAVAQAAMDSGVARLRVDPQIVTQYCHDFIYEGFLTPVPALGEPRV